MLRNSLLTFIAVLFIFGCKEEKSNGCTDADACNYDSSASGNDGSCYYICLTDAEKSRVTDFVESAINYIDQHGQQKAFEAFESADSSFIDNELYIWVWDSAANVLSHGFQPSLIGQNVYNLQDIAGKYFVHEMIDNIRQDGEGWTWYYWDDPVTNSVRKKFGFVKEKDNLIIGSGTYK